MTVFNSPLGQMITPHTSTEAMTDFVNDITGLHGYNIFSPNAGIFEQAEMQSTAATVQEETLVRDTAPVEGL